MIRDIYDDLLHGAVMALLVLLVLLWSDYTGWMGIAPLKCGVETYYDEVVMDDIHRSYTGEGK